MKLNAFAKACIRDMSVKDRKDCLAAAKLLYMQGIITPKRYEFLSKALQRYRR